MPINLGALLGGFNQGFAQAQEAKRRQAETLQRNELIKAQVKLYEQQLKQAELEGQQVQRQAGARQELFGLAAGTPGAAPGTPEEFQQFETAPFEALGAGPQGGIAPVQPRSILDMLADAQVDPIRRQRAEQLALQSGLVRDIPELAQIREKGARPTLKLQTQLGQALQDIDTAAQIWGPESDQVAALTEATQAEQADEPKTTDIAGIRKEFTSQSKEFVSVRNAYTRLQSATAEPSAAGDLAMIFNFMKMLDPGSAVREGEQATASNAAGVPDRVRNLWNRLLTGERLVPEQRQDFLNQAKNLYRGQLGEQRKLEGEFRRIAKKQFGEENVDLVVVDFIGGQQAGPAAPSLTLGQQQAAGALPQGWSVEVE